MDVLLHIHLLVGVPGLEPGKAGPESAVLPLHHTPIPLQGETVFSIAGAKVMLFSEPTKKNGTFLIKNAKKIFFPAFFFVLSGLFSNFALQ